MSFAGLKQRAKAGELARQAGAARIADERARFDEAAARGLVDAAEARVDQAVALGARELCVMRVDVNAHCRLSALREGPCGFSIDWHRLTREDLRGVALRVYDLLVERRGALPDDDRFSIELRADPQGYGALVGWDVGIYITW